MSHYTSVDNPRPSVYSTDLNDYYDGAAIPAPHRLSGFASSFNTPTASQTDLPRSSSVGSMTQMTQTYTPVLGSYRDPYDNGEAYDKEEIMMDPQGRSAARLAQRRGEGAEYAAVGAGAAGMSEAYDPPYTASPKPSRKKWIWTAMAAFLLVALGVGLGVGLTVGKKSSNGAQTGNAASTGKPTTQTGDDPSVFEKDSRLHNSFWAFAYTPQNVLLPACGASQSNVTRDIQLLSQLTNKLRLYGANCNQTALVLQAIRDTKVDMKVHLAVYVDSNEQAYVDQVKAIEEALKTYGTEHVLGITVGNEYILNQQTAGLSTAATATQTILTRIQEMNTTVQGWGLDKTLPLGTSDAGSLMSTTLAAGIDYFHANVHPWFGTVGIDQAAAWTNNFFQEFDVDIANSVPNKPRCAIAETGWPTNTMTASEGNNGVASPQGDASIANLQTFLDTFVCQANANGTDYFFFEAFDEPWKAQFGGVEPYWGLFDSDRNLKSGLTIPECDHT
ncbi:hypothetical protein NCC49_003877 [Naganishia albida]|nr:hypothetical protein NCC49_003877 [Naganishia albida]